MKIRKIILRITLTFCALLLGAVALVFLLLVLGIRIDLAPFHGKLEAAVTEAAGRKVTIAEPLSVKLSFLPLVEAGGLRVAGPGGSKEELLRLGPSKLQISLASLLRKELLVTRLSSKSVGVSLPGGAQEPGGASTAEPAEKSSEGSGGFRFGGVKSFSFPSLEVRYHGPGEDDSTVVSVQELEGSALRGAPLTAGAQFIIRRQPVSASLTMPPFDTILASGSPWPLEIRGEAPGIEAAATVPGGPTAEAGWPEVEFSLGGDELGSLEWLAGRALPEAGPFTLTGLLTVRQPGATISNIRAEIAGSSLDGALSLDLADERPRVTGGLKAGTLDFETIMNLAPGGEAAREEGETPSPAVAAGPAEIDLGADMDLSFTVEEVINAPVEARNISLGLQAGDGTLKLPFSGSVDVFAIQGEVQAGGEKPRPHLALSMAAKEIDVALLSAAGPAKEVGEQGRPASAEGASSWPARYLSLLDADLSLEAGSLKGAPLEVRKIFIGGTLRNGKLNLPFKATLDGVPARGAFEVKARGDLLAAVIGASAGDVDLTPLSRRIPQLQSVKGMIGKAGVSLSLEGSDLDSMKKSLSGRIDLEGADLTWQDSGGEKTVDISIEQGSLHLPGPGRIEGEMEGSLLGEPLGVDFSLQGDRRYDLEGPLKLEAEAEGGGGKVTLKGTLSGQKKSRRLAFDFTLGGDRLGGLAAWTGLPPAAGGPYALDGGLALDGKGWQVSIGSLALGRSRLSGELGMVPGETRPLLTASLHAEILDLAELQNIYPEELPSPPGEATGGKGEIPDVDLDLLIDHLPTAMGEVTELQTSLSIREGQLRETPIRFTFDGALYQGKWQMSREEGLVTAGLFLSAEGVDGGSLLEKAGTARDMVARIGKAQLEINASGSSLEDLGDSLRLTAMIEDSELTLPDPHTDESVLVQAKKLILEKKSARAVELQFDGSLGEHPVSAEGDLVISKGKGEAPGKASARLEIAGFDSSIKLDGSFPLPLSPVGTEMTFSLSGESFDRFNQIMDVSLPPFGPVKARGRLSIDGEGYQLTDTAITIGETEVRSSARIIRAREKPRVEVEFRSDRVQVDDFSLKGWSPVEIKEEASSPSKEPEEVEAAPVIHPEVLRRFEGSLKVEATEVFSGENSLGSASLQGSLENDRLDLTLDLNIPAGDIRFESAFDASGETSSTDLTLVVENFDYGRLTEEKESQDSGRGKMAAVIELTSRGEDFSRIMENATGRVDFTVLPIGLKSRIFNFWAGNVFLAVLPAIGTGSASQVNCIVGLLDMEDGFMKPKSLILDTSTVRVKGQGEVDLKEGRLDLTLRPTAKRPQFFTLATPVWVSGPLTDPRVELSPLSLGGVYLRNALSIFTVPLRWVFEKKMPADGSDVCLPPPEERQR